MIFGSKVLKPVEPVKTLKDDLRGDRANNLPFQNVKCPQIKRLQLTLSQLLSQFQKEAANFKILRFQKILFIKFISRLIIIFYSSRFELKKIIKKFVYLWFISAWNFGLIMWNWTFTLEFWIKLCFVSYTVKWTKVYLIPGSESDRQTVKPKIIQI